MEEVNGTYLKKCLFHKTLHPLCPVFSLGYVVRESGQDFRSLAEKVWMGWGGASKEYTAQGHKTGLPVPSCLPNFPGIGQVYALDLCPSTRVPKGPLQGLVGSCHGGDAKNEEVWADSIIWIFNGPPSLPFSLYSSPISSFLLF